MLFYNFNSAIRIALVLQLQKDPEIRVLDAVPSRPVSFFAKVIFNKMNHHLKGTMRCYKFGSGDAHRASAKCNSSIKYTYLPRTFSEIFA